MIKIINKTSRTVINEQSIIDDYVNLHKMFEAFPNFRPGSRQKTSYWTSYTAGRSIDLNTGYDWLETTHMNNNEFTAEQMLLMQKIGVGLYNKSQGISGHCIHYLIKKIIDNRYKVWIFIFHINDAYNDMDVNIVVMEQGDYDTLKLCRNANDRKQFLIR